MCCNKLYQPLAHAFSQTKIKQLYTVFFLSWLFILPYSYEKLQSWLLNWKITKLFQKYDFIFLIVSENNVTLPNFHFSVKFTVYEIPMVAQPVYYCTYIIRGRGSKGGRESLWSTGLSLKGVHGILLVCLLFGGGS